MYFTPPSVTIEESALQSAHTPRNEGGNVNTEVSTPNEREGPIQPHNWWWLATAMALAIILGLGTLQLVGLLSHTLALLILGISIAAAVAPLINWVTEWLPRTLATVLVYLLLLIIVGIIGWIILPPLINQAVQLADRLPELADQVRQWINQWNIITTDTLIERLSNQLSAVGSTLLDIPLTISSYIVDLALTLVISLYLVIYAPRIRRFFLSLYPPHRRKRVGEVASKVTEAMGGYIRGTVISGLIIGTVVYIALLIIGVDFPLVLALVAGVMELVPVVGPYISGTIIVLVALLDSQSQALITLGVVIVEQQIENNLVVPNVMSSQAEISPIMTILALFAGASIGGIIGALVAVPIAAASHVLVVEVLAPAIRRQTDAPPHGQDEANEKE